MHFFKLNLKSATYSVIFIISCFTVYTLQRYSHAASFIATPSPLTSKIQDSYNLFAQNVGNVAHKYLMLLDLKQQIQGLEQENQKLKAELQVLNEVKIENERLTRLHDIKSILPDFINTPARVTGQDLFTDHFSLFLDKGSENNITNLAGVITYEGVVGYTIDVQKDNSRILLLNDRLMSLDAMVQRTRSRGIISGYGKNLSVLKFLDRPQDLAIGDLVVTSLDQKMFPPGFPIGQITSIYVHPSGVGHYAIIRPVVDSKKISEALILKNRKS